MDAELVRDLFASILPIQIRRLFGGQGIYAEGRIVALVFGDSLYLKGDEAAGALYEAAGASRWCYMRASGASAAMPYWSAPEAMYDDPDEAARWVAIARDCARSAAAPKRVKSRSSRRSPTIR